MSKEEVKKRVAEAFESMCSMTISGEVRYCDKEKLEMGLEDTSRRVYWMSFQKLLEQKVVDKRVFL